MYIQLTLVMKFQGATKGLQNFKLLIFSILKISQKCIDILIWIEI